jgi:hypothetical protein
MLRDAAVYLWADSLDQAEYMVADLEGDTIAVGMTFALHIHARETAGFDCMN